MKNISGHICLLLIIIVFLSSSTTVSAGGNVFYDGDAKDFVFSPGSEYSPTDLFTDLKNVMPGDKLNQQIHIENNVTKDKSVKIYMRSLGAQEGTDAFLSQLTLTVTQNNGSALYEAPANDTAQLTDWVYLGKLYYGGEMTLDVILTVPETLGNEFCDAVGYLDWQFMVEEYIEQAPPTGDSMAVYWYMAFMSFFLVCVLCLLSKCKTKVY